MGALIDFLSEYQKQLTGYEKLPKEITDRYEVETCLKETDQKQVYVVRSKLEDRKCVLKCVSGESQEKLEEEYRLQEALSHEGIAKPSEIICIEDSTYLIRDYIPGNTVTELVEMSKEAHLSENEILDISLQLCDILHYLHNQSPPIIHRDIKPDNIIVTKRGKCVLIDFGISRRIHMQRERDTVVMGTRFTAPPEQYGFKQTDARSDIYSLGILMFYMVTGSLDINEINLYQIPRRLRKCIIKCTRFSPEDRYVSVKKLESCLKREKLLLEIEVRRILIQIFVLIAACTITFILIRNLYHPNLSVNQNDSQAMTLVSPLVHDTDTKEMVLSDDSVYHFNSKLIEEAVRQELGKAADDSITVGELKQVRELYICGKQVYRSWDEHMGFGTNQLMSDEEYTSTMLYNQRGDITSIEDLAYMPNIRTLALYYQNVVDIAPLQKLTKLVNLGLGTNRINNLDPLKNLTKLNTLDVAGNPVSDEEMNKICDLPYLQNLDVSATDVGGFEEFAKMKLISLSVMEDQLWNCDGIEKLTTMKTLMISGVNKSITEEGFRNICKLTGLEDLSIFSGSKIDVSVFTGMRSLTRLVLCGVPVDEISGLAGMKLSNLDLTGSQVSDLSPLKNMPSLSFLNLKNIPCDNYKVLLSLPHLNTLECDNSQKQQIKKQLGSEIPFDINVIDYGK